MLAALQEPRGVDTLPRLLPVHLPPVSSPPGLHHQDQAQQSQPEVSPGQSGDLFSQLGSSQISSVIAQGIDTKLGI